MNLRLDPKPASAVLKFLAGTLNSLALAFFVFGILNPLEAQPKSALIDEFTADKFRELIGDGIIVVTGSGYDLNLLLGSLGLYALALLSTWFSAKLQPEE